MSTPIERAADIIMSRLKDDADLKTLVKGVYRDKAPAKAPMPYAIFSLSETGDDNALDGTTAYAESELFVRVVGQGFGIGLIDGAASRVNDLLAGWKQEDPENKMGIACQRTRPYNTMYGGEAYDELPGIGAYYRLRVMPDDGKGAK